MRKDLENFGTIIDENNYEIARITPTGGLVVDLQDLYMYIYNVSRDTNNIRVHGSALFKRYGRNGTWRRDQYVVDALSELQRLKTIKMDDLGGHSVIVETVMLPKEALKKIPKYVTGLEALGGLEEIVE